MMDQTVPTAGNHVDWALFGGGAALAVGLMVTGLVMFLVLWRHMKGRLTRLAPEDAGQVAVYGQTRGIYQADQAIIARGEGVEATLTINIDTLRKAWQRGDGKTFWLWPLSMTFIFVGLLIAFWVPMLVFHAGPPMFLAAAFLLVFPLILWFMAWAAVHTKIDLGADDAAARSRKQASTAPTAAAGLREPPTALRVVALAFAGTALAMGAISGVLARGELSFRQRAARAPGRVVSQSESHERTKSSDGFAREETLYAPMFEYEAPGGKRTFVGRVRTNPPSFEIGEAVVVLYLPGPSASAEPRIDSFGQNWLSVIIFGSLSFVFLVVATILALRYRSFRTRLR